MADAILWSLLEDVQTGLQSLTFSAQGSDPVRTIKDSSIVIRDRPASRSWFANWFQNEQVPGIIISPVEVKRPATAGTNVRDDAFYTVSCEIIDKHGGHKLRSLRTYLKWQEQIARYLHSQTRANLQTYANGQVCIGWSLETDHVDPRIMKQHKMAVGVVLVQFKVRETRTSV